MYLQKKKKQTRLVTEMYSSFKSKPHLHTFIYIWDFMTPNTAKAEGAPLWTRWLSLIVSNHMN